MAPTTTTPPQDEFDRVWLERAVAYGKAVDRIVIAERSGRVKAADYEKLVDAAIAFAQCERDYAALGCRPPGLPDGPELSAMLDVLDGARQLADALPSGAPKRELDLFKRTWSHLVNVARRRGRP